jgi:hypothetical protein
VGYEPILEDMAASGDDDWCEECDEYSKYCDCGDPYEPDRMWGDDE